MASTGTLTLDTQDNSHNSYLLETNALDTAEGVLTTFNTLELDVRLYSQVLATFHNTDSSYTAFIQIYESSRWIDSATYPAGDPLTNATLWTKRGTTIVLPPSSEDYIYFSLAGSNALSITGYASSASYTADALDMDLHFDRL